MGDDIERKRGARETAGPLLARRFARWQGTMLILEFKNYIRAQKTTPVLLHRAPFLGPSLFFAPKDQPRARDAVFRAFFRRFARFLFP